MKKALLIGINYYNTPCKLNGCINDAVNLKELFVSRFGYVASNITILRDDDPNPIVQPTRTNILGELSKLIADSANCSEIWVCYSGHGSQMPDRNMEETDGLDELIVPVDYMTNGIIADDEINRILQQSKCRTMLLFDSCCSGSVCDLPWCFEYKNPIQYNRRLENYSSYGKWTNPQVFMISGCKDYQTSSDVYNYSTQQFNGEFTAAFIACVKAIKFNLNILLLYRNICMLIQQHTSTQLPTLSSSSSVANIDIVIAPPSRSLKDLILATPAKLEVAVSKHWVFSARNAVNRKCRKLTFHL
jgi:hypothetical protein